MDFLIFAAVVGMIYGCLFFFDTIFKSCMHYPYDAFLRGTGLTVKFGRIQWYTTALNRTVLKLATRHPVLLNWSFDIGVWVTVALLPLICVGYFVWTFLARHTSFGDGHTPTVSELDIGLEIMMPGVNLPLDEIGHYIGALGVCSVVHELGHAFAAVLVDVPVTGFGFHLLLIFPVAYTELSTDKIALLKLWSKLRILTAGIWHNFLLATVFYVIYLMLSLLFMPLYTLNAGVIITHMDKQSPLIGARGLTQTDVITNINDCEVHDMNTWFGCLLKTIRQPPAFCVSSDFILVHDESVPVFHSPEGMVECCSTDSTRNVCYEFASEDENNALEVPQHVCMDARQTIEHSSAFCQFDTKKCLNSYCVRALLNNVTTMMQIKRLNRPDVMYIGHPTDISKTIRVSEFIPKTKLFRPAFAEGVSRFLRYVVVFSLGLAFVNALPCFAFDGQHIVSALVHHGLPALVPDRSRRDLIAFGITSVGSLMFFAGIIKVTINTYYRNMM